MYDLSDETYRRLRHLVRAGASCVQLVSHEWERIRGFAIGLSDDQQLAARVWSQSRGLEKLEESHRWAVEDGDARDPIAILERICGEATSGVWLLEDFHPFLRDEHHQVHRWLREVCRLPASPKKVVLLSTPFGGQPLGLSKEVPALELPLPGREELRAVLEGVGRDQAIHVEAGDEALLDSARGLTVMEARLAFGQAASERGRLDRSVVPLVSREKERIIRQSEVLEYFPAEARMEDIGGLGLLKDWLVKRGRAYGAGAREFGLDAPKGVLLLGIQGCGKSLLAKAVAATWEFPLLRFDLGKVFGGIVGQSEGNIRLALQVAQALAPCVLWIDEIEKGLSGMGSSDQTDGGTTARVVGTLLTWMQEKRDPVFVVATANRIDMLPPELLRKGRFDEVFFVDLPTCLVREEILSIHLRKKHRDPAKFDLSALAKAAQGYSGAELEEAVKDGLFDAFAEGRELTTEHIRRAQARTYPLSRTMREQIEGLRKWAKARARMASPEEAEAIPAGGDEDTPTLRQESARNPFIPRTGTRE